MGDGSHLESGNFLDNHNNYDDVKNTQDYTQQGLNPLQPNGNYVLLRYHEEIPHSDHTVWYVSRWEWRLFRWTSLND
jgi:hypothetical protein